jgi:ribosomal protein S27E
MSIAVTCPGCRQELTVKDEMAGKRGRCPRCRDVVVIPSSGPAAIPSVAPAPEFVDAADERRQPRLAPMPRSPGLTMPWLVGTVGALVIISLIGALVLFHALRRFGVGGGTARTVPLASHDDLPRPAETPRPKSPEKPAAVEQAKPAGPAPAAVEPPPMPIAKTPEPQSPAPEKKSPPEKAPQKPAAPPEKLPEKPASPPPMKSAEKPPAPPAGPNQPWQSDPIAFAKLFFGEDDFKRRSDRKNINNSEAVKKQVAGRRVTWDGVVVALPRQNQFDEPKNTAQVFIGDGFIQITSIELGQKLRGFKQSDRVRITFTIGVDFLLALNNLSGLPVIMVGAEIGTPVEVERLDTGGAKPTAVTPAAPAPGDDLSRLAPLSGPAVDRGVALERWSKGLPAQESALWLQSLVDATGQNANDTFLQCTSAFGTRMGVLFDGATLKPEVAERMRKRLDSLKHDEFRKWHEVFNQVMGEKCNHCSLALLLILADGLFENDAYAPAKAAKYLDRAKQLRRDAINRWCKQFPLFKDSELDAALSIALLDRFFPQEKLDAAALAKAAGAGP